MIQSGSGGAHQVAAPQLSNSFSFFNFHQKFPRCCNTIFSVFGIFPEIVFFLQTNDLTIKRFNHVKQQNFRWWLVISLLCTISIDNNKTQRCAKHVQGKYKKRLSSATSARRAWSLACVASLSPSVWRLRRWKWFNLVRDQTDTMKNILLAHAELRI